MNSNSNSIVHSKNEDTLTDDEKEVEHKAFDQLKTDLSNDIGKNT